MLEGDKLRRTLRLVRFSPNHAAVDIHERTGIYLEPKPSQVVWNVRNKIALILNSPTSLELSLKLLGHNSWIGFYLPEFHTFINKPEAGILTEYHENWHGFVQLTNPEIHDWKKYVERMVKKFINDTQNPDFQTLIAKGCLTEGIACWGEIKTGLLSNDSLIQEKATLLHRDWLGGEKMGIINQDYMDAIFAKLYLLRETLDACFESKELKEGFHQAKNAWPIASDLTRDQFLHRLGYYFVHESMEWLTQQGLSLPDALRLIVNNPPRKIEDLHKPFNYLKTLF